MDLTNLEELAAKMHVLKDFVEKLRLNPENPNNMVLAAAVERILKVGSTDEIKEKFDKV